MSSLKREQSEQSIANGQPNNKKSSINDHEEDHDSSEESDYDVDNQKKNQEGKDLF